MAHVETARTRRRYVEAAGWKTTSGLSVLAGTLVAFGAVAVVAAAAGATGSALGLDTEGISTSEWRQAGIAGAAIGALVLFVSFFFGGYTAGRMGRRAGARHGLLVFLLSAVLIGLVALVAWAASPSVDLAAEGIPTDADTWGDIGLGAAIAAAAAMAIGAILGGIRGDRWHGRLATAVEEHRVAELEAEREAERDAERDAEMHRTRTQAAVVDDEPVVVDRTESIDLTDTVPTEPSVEEEREHTRTTLG